MKLALNIIAGLVVLAGLVFFLQGIGLLKGSTMTSQTQWAVIGFVMFVIGIGLIYFNYRRHPST